MERVQDQPKAVIQNGEHRTDFFVVGVVKGGTTSLYQYLNQHPEIYLPPIKEINHFSQEDIDASKFLPEYALDVKIDLARYFERGMPEMHHIAHVNDVADYARLYHPAGDHQQKGDISNSYMICPSSAKAINEHNSKGKIVVVLRNPITRVWSQYLMNLREAKTEEKDFREELKQDSSKTHQGWGVNHQYLNLGMYHSQLNRYYEHYPSEQIHVMIFEEYVTNPAKHLASLCRFLGVDEQFKFDFTKKKNQASQARMQGLNRFLVRSGAIALGKQIIPRSMREQLSKLYFSDKKLGSISNEDSSYLSAYYQQEVSQLGELLGRDLSAIWPEFKD